MKIGILLFVLSTTLNASAWADGVFGTWNFPEQSSGGVAFDLSMTIAQDSVAISNTCKYADGMTKTVQTTSKAVVTDHSIEVTEATSASDDSDADHTCRISISPGESDYVVSHDTLTLTTQGQSIVLSRAQ